MRSIVWLFLVVLCSAILLNAQDKSDQWAGWVCDSACVTHSGGIASCNANCTQQSGEAVFIRNDGKVTKIANQEACKPYMNKRVKVKAVQDYKQQQEQIRLMDITDDSGGS